MLDNRPVDVGGIDIAEEGIRLYEAFRKGPGRIVDFDD